ncbi:hypothetical protein MKW92_043783 [Papaver armeniacum]|nr:hypothetical protein MKW92_043783 [Papaver armeniacum]
MASSSHVSKKYELDCQYLHCFFSSNDSSNQQKIVKILTMEPNARDAEILLIAFGSVHFDGCQLNMVTFFWQILVAVAKSSRCYSGKVSTSMAMCDSKTLYEAMESGRCIDEKTILSIMSQRSTEQLTSIFISYKQLYAMNFPKSLKRNKCGQFGKELRTIIRCIQYPDKYFAKKLRKSSNTDVREVLIRTIITRHGIDIKDINQAYASKAGNTLQSLVRRKFDDTISWLNF